GSAGAGPRGHDAPVRCITRAQQHRRWTAWRWRGLDEYHVMRKRRAIEAVHSQPNPAGLVWPAKDRPLRVGGFKGDPGPVEAQVADPERNRLSRYGNVDDDGHVNFEAEITARQRGSFTGEKHSQEKIAARCDGGQVKRGPRAAQAPADRLD